ncbi:MAG: PIN domain-containing protein [Dehalococcoidia bacterium]
MADEGRHRRLGPARTGQLGSRLGSGRPADFITATSGFRRIALDSSACVYYLRGEPLRGRLVAGLIERALDSLLAIHVPAIVQLELLVRPYRSGNPEELARVRSFTERQPGVRTAPISKDVLFGAAQVRALTSLKVPDALVVSSAAVGRCDGIVGNDTRFAALNRFETLHLSAMGELRLPRYIHLDDYVAVSRGGGKT